MAANGGMNLAVGLELSQFDKDFQKLTSKVESIGSQLGKYLDLVPTVNTKAFEASVQKMDKLWKQHIKAFEDQNFELKVGVRGVDASNKQAIVDTRSFKFDDLFGSIDKAENSIKQLKSFLRNPSGFEGNFGQIKEIVQYQEAIIRNWKTATGEVHKQDAAVKTAIAREAQLQQQRQNALRKIEAESQLKRRSLEEDRANAKLLSKRIDQIHAEQRAVNGLLKEYENLAKKQRQYGADDSAANQRIAKLKQEKVELQNLEGEEIARIKALNQNNSLFNDQGRIIGRLRTLASRYVSIFTIGHLANKIIETTGYFEKQQVALEGIVRSATKAAEIMNQIKAFAPNSPFQTRQLVDYTKKLAAFSIPADKLFDTTKKLADLSAGLGVDMERIILAYGQVKAAAVLRGQELRQFTEAGIPMVEELRKKLSELRGEYVSQGQVFEAISKRQVSFQMVADVLSNMTSEGGKFYKMQENLMNTIYGQREKLKDLWTLALNDIGTSSNKTISGILKMLQSAIKNAKSLISGLFVTIIINSAVSATKRIKELIAQFRMLGAAGVSPWGAIAVGAGIAVAWVKKLWDENHKIDRQFSEIHNSFQKQLRNTIKGLDELIQKLGSAGKGSKAYQEAFDTLTANYSQYADITDAYVQSLLKEESVYNNLVESITKYNAALEKKQQLEQTKATMGESFELGDFWTDAHKYTNTPNSLYEAKFGMSYDIANSAFSDAMKSLFAEMRDKNLLSISEDKATRDKENYDVFKELLPKALKSQGVEFIYKDLMSVEKLWNDFNKEAFNDNDSRRTYAKYRQLRREELGEGDSDFAWLSRIENTFKDLPITLSKELENTSAQEYSRQYNTRWIQELLNYLENGPDFNGRTVKDADGNLVPAAQNELNSLLDKMREEIKNFDEASISNVNQSLEQYHKALSSVDEEGAAMLTHLMKIFEDGTQEASDRAAAVRETIFKAWEPGSKESEYARQFLPTDATYNDIKNKLPQTHIAKIEELAKYGVTVDGAETIPTKRYKTDSSRVHSELDKAEIERLKMEERILVRLMEGVQDGMTITAKGTNGKVLQAQMFDIMDREKNFTGGGGHDHEFPDFYNILKNAYELYKKALQQGGVKNGINEVRTNAKIQEVYGGLFGGEGGTDFDSKIGNKTLGEILVGSGREHLIKGGLEDGIVNFREAGQALADELEAFGKANKKTHGSYIRMAEQIRKWVDETFTKDEIQKWLESFERSVQNLTIDFENMHTNMELAKKMSAQGTSDMFASVAGTAAPDWTRLKSAIQRENIGKLIEQYNVWARGVVDDKGNKPQELKLKDTNTLKDIAEYLVELNEQKDINNKAFKATEAGNVLLGKLIPMLKELSQIIEKEAASVSGKSFSGNSFVDAVKNALIEAEHQQNENKNAQEKAGEKRNDLEAANRRVASARQSTENIMKSLMENNQFEAIYKAMTIHQRGKGIQTKQLKEQFDKMVAGLPELEQKQLEDAWNKLQREVRSFNAKKTVFAPFWHEMTQYRTAGSRAKKQYDEYVAQGNKIEGISYDEGTNSFKINEGVKLDPETLAQYEDLNRKLQEVGMNGQNLAKVFADEALENIANFAKESQNALDALSGCVTGIVKAFKGFAHAVNHAYDVMNDGENPGWMQDTEGFLDDFTEAFENMIAPIGAVLALIIAITVAVAVLGTTAGIVFGVIVAAAAIFAALVAAFQVHDRRLERQIEKLKDEVEELDAAMQHLQSIANRTVGFEKLRNEIAATGKELEKAALYAEMANKEIDKKNTDDDKVREYERSQQQALDAFEEGVRQMRDTLVKSTDDWASQMGSAIRQAFQNGENAARAFRDTVKTMIGDVIENMLQMAILEPLIESAIEAWTNSDYLKQKYTKTIKGDDGITRKEFDQDNYLKELLQNIGDPDKAENFYQSMLMICDTLIDTVNCMPSVLQDFYKHNSELGTLSGGIESVTEDTARRIEALENSQLGEIFAIRTILEQYLGNSGGFGDSTMASVQAAVVSIASDTSVISRIMQSFENQLNELRTGPSRPLHVTMV